LVDFVQFLQLGVALLDHVGDIDPFLDLALEQLFGIIECILDRRGGTSAWLMRRERYWMSSALSAGASAFSAMRLIYFSLLWAGEEGSYYWDIYQIINS